jgi:Meiotically Up-regulated Gene 113 (MUG113) protein
MTAVNRDRTYLYVASGHCRLHSKIGVSGHPNQRVSLLRHSYDYTVELEQAFYCPINIALRAERCAHLLLHDFSLGGEWFSVEPHVARDAASQAMLMVNSGAFTVGATWGRWNVACRVPPEKVRYRFPRRGEPIPSFEQIVEAG